MPQAVAQLKEASSNPPEIDWRGRTNRKKQELLSPENRLARSRFEKQELLSPGKRLARGAQTNLVLRDLPFINYQILNPPKIITTWSNINTQTSGKSTKHYHVMFRILGGHVSRFEPVLENRSTLKHPTHWSLQRRKQKKFPPHF